MKKKDYTKHATPLYPRTITLLEVSGIVYGYKEESLKGEIKVDARLI